MGEARRKKKRQPTSKSRPSFERADCYKQSAQVECYESEYMENEGGTREREIRIFVAQCISSERSSSLYTACACRIVRAHVSYICMNTPNCFDIICCAVVECMCACLCACIRLKYDEILVFSTHMSAQLFSIYILFGYYYFCCASAAASRI